MFPSASESSRVSAEYFRSVSRWSRVAYGQLESRGHGRVTTNAHGEKRLPTQIPDPQD